MVGSQLRFPFSSSTAFFINQPLSLHSFLWHSSSHLQRCGLHQRRIESPFPQRINHTNPPSRDTNLVTSKSQSTTPAITMLTPRPSPLRQTYTSLRNCRRPPSRGFFQTSRPQTGRASWWPGAALPIAVGVATSFCVLVSAPLARLDSLSGAPLPTFQNLWDALKDYPLVDLFNDLSLKYFTAPPENKQNLGALIALVWRETIHNRVKEGWQPTRNDDLVHWSAVCLLNIYGLEKFSPDPLWQAQFAELEERKLRGIAAMTGSSWAGVSSASEGPQNYYHGLLCCSFHTRYGAGNF